MPQEILSLRFLFLYTVFLLAQSGSSTFNITRYTKGDVFQNTNSSESCIDTCVLNDENSQFCAVNCCSCVCPSHSPTYLLNNGNCSSEDRLMAILKAQSGIQGESIFVLWKLGLNWLCMLNVPSAILNYRAGIVGVGRSLLDKTKNSARCEVYLIECFFKPRVLMTVEWTSPLNVQLEIISVWSGPWLLHPWVFINHARSIARIFTANFVYEESSFAVFIKK